MARVQRLFQATPLSSGAELALPLLLGVWPQPLCLPWSFPYSSGFLGGKLAICCFCHLRIYPDFHGGRCWGVTMAGRWPSPGVTS